MPMSKVRLDIGQRSKIRILFSAKGRHSANSHSYFTPISYSIHQKKKKHDLTCITQISQIKIALSS